MTIKAIVRNGFIEPLEPLPPDWAEGKEVLIGDLLLAGAEDLEAWARELEATATELPAEEHDLFRKALDDIEHQSKDAVRREWSIP